MDSVNSIPMTQLVKEYQQNVWQKVSVPRAFSSCRKDGALMGEPGVAKVIFVYELCKTPDLWHEFLRKAGLLKKDLTCAKCNSPMKLRSKDINDGAVWTCRNRINKECGLQKSVRFGSWFSCRKLTMGEFLFRASYEEKGIDTFNTFLELVRKIDWTNFTYAD
ncbi:DDE_Tnp_IS1595 domain-containing protein [Nephila pilipes]|uniref:DDE_Tnp_IS1595 domain-containing protein n=1 Tax=Nephila pilipes TaxID=299642 RepID=A0A8X6QEI7_NEPPI|nr:DDE_Tnp_IS1595 domain-containing protein [Nephila pilipes]